MVAIAAVSAFALPAGSAFAAAPARARVGPCAPTSPALVATLGTWSPEARPTTDPKDFANDESNVVYDQGGLAVGLGRLVARRPDGLPRSPSALIVLRTTLRGDRAVRLELCRGRNQLATAPIPSSDRRSRIVALSVNGDRIAWRTWRAGRRGTVTVGRVAGGRVVDRRRASQPAVAKRHAVNGRILVMPDGTASWSVGLRGRAAVWLWPHDAPARRLAVPADRAAAPDGWDVRIVDDRHVLLRDTATVLRYGPATPGRCPEPLAATTDALGRLRLVTVPRTRVWGEDSGRSVWAQTLVCDPDVGEYVHVHANSTGGDKYGNVHGASPIASLTTAGVLVQVDAQTGGGAATEVTPLATRAPTTARGLVDDPETLAMAASRYAWAAAGAHRVVGVRVLPGVVAWASGPIPRPDDPTIEARDVWVADADGARVVGRLPAGAPADPGLTLTPSAVGWAGPDGVSVVPVRPVPGDLVHRVAYRGDW